MSGKAKLLIIDDDRTLVQAMVMGFKAAGYQVVTASDGLQGLQVFQEEHPDLVILDVMMPKMDGLETCRRLRESWTGPVIMLTARAQMTDRVAGLEQGADDYVVKPFAFKELATRVELLLQRSRTGQPQPSDIVFSDGRLVIDRASEEVTIDGERADLTSTEARLLIYLAQNPNRPLTPEQIRDAVWGAGYLDQLATVKLHIWRLQQKIEPNPSQPRYIVAERDLGYRFCKSN